MKMGYFGNGYYAHSVLKSIEVGVEIVGLLKKAIGGIGMYASQKKSQGEYSGPCQMCHAQGVKLFAYSTLDRY